MENRVFRYKHCGSGYVYIWFLEGASFIYFHTSFYCYNEDMGLKESWIQNLGSNCEEINIKSLLTFENPNVRRKAREFLDGK